jgi:hypothetical protein
LGLDQGVIHRIFGPSYDLTFENADGFPVIRVQCNRPDMGMRITLTFPVRASADVERFKERLVRLTLNKQYKRQGTA